MLGTGLSIQIRVLEENPLKGLKPWAWDDHSKKFFPPHFSIDNSPLTLYNSNLIYN
jgi:hypothetical protein